MITIYHNTRCSKSRSALHILEEKGISVTLRHYLQDPLSSVELKELLHKLSMPPTGLLRKSEAIYKDFSVKISGEESWLDAMLQYPQLIERPVVVSGAHAIIARPPERVLELL